MPSGTDIDRQDAILDAAFGVFASYGYRRTTMEDIAQAAGLSRSALYLRFRNKEDIFRSLTHRHFDTAMAEMEKALNRPGQTVESALYAAFLAKDGPLMEIVLTTPHGAELMDAGFSASPDLVKMASARAVDVLVRWLERQDIAPDLGPARALAEMIVSALTGFKSTARTVEDLRAAQHRLACVLGRALASGT
jgi:AcrR family transcriptional regulator